MLKRNPHIYERSITYERKRTKYRHHAYKRKRDSTPYLKTNDKETIKYFSKESFD